jgi:hypothetical protein
MSAPATVELHYTDRAAANRANSQHSTGPRIEAGKQRSSLNALRHGLTASTAVLPSEDPAAYEQHCRQFQNEYQPANPTETQLVQELADTSWRLNRIPLLEADLFALAPSPELLVPALATLGLHSARLSRQFQKCSTSSAPSRTSAATRSAVISATPPASWNSINTKGYPGGPPTMALFFQKTKWNAWHNA